MLRVSILYLIVVLGCSKSPNEGDPALPSALSPPEKFAVTSAADSGSGTLREALELRALSVTFDASVQNIQLESPLPKISTPIQIEAIGGRVVLDGSKLVGVENGLHIGTSQVTLRNLTIRNFPGHGILVANVKGNLLATPGELVLLDNLDINSNQKDGVRIENSEAVLLMGSTIAGNSNGISVFDLDNATTYCGHLIFFGNVIEENRASGVLLDTLRRGEKNGSIESQQHPIGISPVNFAEPIARNRIRKNAEHGVWLRNTGKTMVVVAANNISENAKWGALLSDGSNSAFIGADGFNPGPENAWGNLIEQNGGGGISVKENSHLDGSLNGVYVSVSANTIRKNLGDGLLLDRSSGVLVGGVAVGNLGSPTPIQPNVITENSGSGVHIMGAGLIVSGGAVLGNSIWNTHIALNLGEAVLVDGGAVRNRVGNLDSASIFGPGLRNRIATQTAQSVVVRGAGTSGNLIVGNELGCDGTATTISLESPGNKDAQDASFGLYQAESQSNVLLLQAAGFPIGDSYLAWLISLFDANLQKNVAFI